MEYEAAIDYFQIVVDSTGKQRYTGVSFSPKKDSYLTASSAGALSLGSLTHGYDTVFSVSTDYNGHSKILTKVWQPGTDGSTITKVLGLTLDDDKKLSMALPISDKDKKTQQMWIATCTGGVEYDKDQKDHLRTATFTLENVYHTGVYLVSDNQSLQTSSTAIDWTLTYEPMKPGHVTMQDIVLKRDEKLVGNTTPHLGQTGSLSGQKWSVSPAIPSFLTFASKDGSISQTGSTDTSLAKKTYTITCSNDYGSASVTFTIEVGPN